MTHVRGRRVYLSGPMTGIPDWNRVAFDEAEKRLRELGAQEPYNPANFIERFESLSHAACMYRSLVELVDEALSTEPGYPTPWYDLLVSLPGWEKSAGARLEREVAVACGIEVCNLDEVVE